MWTELVLQLTFLCTFTEEELSPFLSFNAVGAPHSRYLEVHAIHLVLITDVFVPLGQQ